MLGMRMFFWDVWPAQQVTTSDLISQAGQIYHLNQAGRPLSHLVVALGFLEALKLWFSKLS